MSVLLCQNYCFNKDDLLRTLCTYRYSQKNKIYAYYKKKCVNKSCSISLTLYISNVLKLSVIHDNDIFFTFLVFRKSYNTICQNLLYCHIQRESTLYIIEFFCAAVIGGFRKFLVFFIVCLVLRLLM